MNLVPKDTHKSSVSSTNGFQAASISALPDALANGMVNVPIAHQINNRHPLESRLEQWDETRDSMKLEMQRAALGSGSALRSALDRKIVEMTEAPGLLNAPSHIHRDILRNRADRLDWDDVFDGYQPPKDIHTAMAKKMGI